MRIKSILTHQLSLKIIALVLTLLLWSYVYFVFGVRIVKNITLPVQLVNISENYIAQSDHQFIEVLFSAPANMIDEAEKNIRAVIDLGGYSSGSFKRNPDISHPEKVIIENISPAVVEVTIEQIISKEISIRPQIKGEPLKGNMLGTIELNPEFIVVRGPESTINNIAEATVTIDVTGANADLFSSIEVSITDHEQKSIDNVEINQRIIKVHVPVVSSNVSKIVPVVPRFQGAPAFRVDSVEIVPPLVTLKGHGSVLETITSALTEEIDISGLAKSTTFTVKLKKIENVFFEPPDQTFEVTITLKEDAETVFHEIPLRVIDLPEHLDIRLHEEFVRVRLYGPKNILEQLSINEAWVDGSKLTIGKQEVPVFIHQLPPEIIVHIYPSEITLEVFEKKA